MSDTTTATTQDPAEKKDDLKTEAAELEQDIKEAEKEAEQARDKGDDARADRLEASIAETKKELGEIKTLLKGLTERPFHPAPGDADKPPADGAAGSSEGEQKQGQEQTEDTTETKPKKRHWLYGDRWNEE